MTPADFRATLDRLRLSQSEAARRWRISLRTVQAWATGYRPIPTPVVTILALEEQRLTPRAVELDSKKPVAG